MCINTDCSTQNIRNDPKNTNLGMVSICAIDVRMLWPLVHSTVCVTPASESVKHSTVVLIHESMLDSFAVAAHLSFEEREKRERARENDK